MAYRKVDNLINALSDEEAAVYRLFGNTAITYVMHKYSVSESMAKVFIEKINAKVKKHQEHEERQMIRHAKINMAFIQASITGSNELLIMSEV